MIDIETMGQTPNAPIIAIGACEVCTLPETFYRVIELQSAVDAGGVIDPPTVLWWMRQADEARDEFRIVGDDITDVLISFSRWIESLWPDKNEVLVWANGASFDFSIIAETYRRCRLARPWHYWNERDYRTMKAMHPHLTTERSNIKHNALDDALYQAEHLHWLQQRQTYLETRA